MSRPFRPLSGVMIAVLLGAALPAAAETLPDGRFTLYGGSGTAMNFLVEDTVRRTGDRIAVSSYRVYAAPVPAARPITQDLTPVVIDCEARTWETSGTHAFDAGDAWVVSAPAEPARVIEEDQIWEFLAEVVCDGHRLHPALTVRGREAARRLAQAQFDHGS